ncbi:MAG: methyltransferase [Silicimonas sp.]|nr:methyltransferase [Silicimonas sp.]
MAGRLSQALEKGNVSLPEGDLLVIGATSASDLSALPPDRTTLLSRYADTVPSRPFASSDTHGTPDAVLVFAPRARDAQRAAIRLARELTDAPIIVDGEKTDGIDALYRELRKRAQVSEAWSKAHGKVFAVTGGDFSDWPALAPAETTDGWWRAPGAFSADGIDKASEMLARALPDSLSGHVIDLGAGWGYLSRAILDRPGVTRVDLVENDRLALEAAERNISDPRAAFHWANALTWHPDSPADHVVTNPPFHIGRAADPSLGQAFIRAAAGMLKPKGQLWLVANRQLPYEGTLKDAFRSTELHSETPSFKVFHATSPNRRKG